MVVVVAAAAAGPGADEVAVPAGPVGTLRWLIAPQWLGRQWGLGGRPGPSTPSWLQPLVLCRFCGQGLGMRTPLSPSRRPHWSHTCSVAETPEQVALCQLLTFLLLVKLLPARGRPQLRGPHSLLLLVQPSALCAGQGQLITPLVMASSQQVPVSGL